MAKPMQQTDNINWTFGMGVRDNNTTSSTWRIEGRDANDIGGKMLHRRGYFIVAGLAQND
jgi:hypothetical protein